MDNTFIDCSVEKKSKANRCTVYKDDSGEILADGLFVFNISRGPADPSELRYAAFGNGIIYLEDARRLRQITASEKDPSGRIISERLRTLTMHGNTQAMDCGQAMTLQRARELSECAMRAFAGRKAFYVSYYWQGVDSFGFDGFVGDSDGNVSKVDYASARWPRNFLQLKGVQPFDENRSALIPCLKPAIFTIENGQLVCEMREPRHLRKDYRIYDLWSPYYLAID